MPKAYFVGEVDVHDPHAYSTYRAQTPATIAEFGGHF